MAQSQEKRSLTFIQSQEFMKAVGPSVTRLLLCGKRKETTTILGSVPDNNAVIDALTPEEIEWIRILDTANAQEKTMLWYAAIVTTLTDLDGYELQSLVASWPLEFLVVLPYAAQFKTHRMLDLTEEEEIYAIEQGAADYDELFALFSSPNYTYEKDPTQDALEMTHTTVYWLSVIMKLPTESVVLLASLAQQRRALSAA